MVECVVVDRAEETLEVAAVTVDQEERELQSF
jgi:hypothetical protein